MEPDGPDGHRPMGLPRLHRPHARGRAGVRREDRARQRAALLHDRRRSDLPPRRAAVRPGWWAAVLAAGAGPLLATTDGGADWTVQPVPRSVAALTITRKTLWTLG